MMKELIEIYKERVRQGEQLLKERGHDMITPKEHAAQMDIYRTVILDLESLQSKGKTKEDAKEDLRSAFGYYSGIGEVDISEEDIDDDFEKWYEQYAQSHANQDGWVSVEKGLPELHSLGMSEDVLTIAGTKMSVKSYDHELKRWNGSPHITVTHWMPLPPKPQI